MLTPHVGGVELRLPYMSRAFDLVAEQVKRFANGEPLKNVVEGDY